MKKLLYFVFSVAITSLLLLLSCKNEKTQPNTEGDSGGSGSSGGGGSSSISAPTGVSAHVQNYDGIDYIVVSWNVVNNAVSYNVYYSTASSGPYECIGSIAETEGYLEASDPENYFKVTAVDNQRNESAMSSYAYCHYSTGGGGSGGGGGGGTTVPTAPTGLTVENQGNNILPYIVVSFNPSSGATSYELYRSSSASGSYSKINENSTTSISDGNPLSGKNYYKVKARNSAGTSGFSSYVSIDVTPTYSPCPPNLTGRMSGNSCVLNWTFPNSTGCGKPETIRIRVKAGDSDWTDVEEIDGNRTSYTFSGVFGYTDSDGYFRIGIIGENSSGTASKAIVYDSHTGNWY